MLQNAQDSSPQQNHATPNVTSAATEKLHSILGTLLNTLQSMIFSLSSLEPWDVCPSGSGGGVRAVLRPQGFCLLPLSVRAAWTVICRMTSSFQFAWDIPGFSITSPTSQELLWTPAKQAGYHPVVYQTREWFLRRKRSVYSKKGRLLKATVGRSIHLIMEGC